MNYSGNVNELTHKIIGCSMKVHNRLGNGFQERIYQKALAIEMSRLGLAFDMEKDMPIYYDGELLGSRRVDFFVESCIMVELKAVEVLENIHKNQAINYLEVYHIANGLLINFGGLSLEFKRVYNRNLIKPGNDPIA